MAQARPFASKDDAIRQLDTLIRDIRIALLVTHADGSALHGRPMETLGQPFDGYLRFFTSASSPKTADIRDDSEVALVYADPAGNRYVFVNGRARLIRDRRLVERLWAPQQAAWFPDGKDDPELRILEVAVTRALWWLRGDEASARRAEQAAIAEHRIAEVGESGTLEFEPQAEPGADAVATDVARPRPTAADREAHNTGAAGRPRAQ